MISARFTDFIFNDNLETPRLLFLDTHPQALHFHIVVGCMRLDLDKNSVDLNFAADN